MARWPGDPIASIRGTVELDKAKAFDRSGDRRSGAEDIGAVCGWPPDAEPAFPPISVYRVGEAHFVRDGHHRVSVMHAMGALHIDAEVTQHHPHNAGEGK